MNVWVLSSIEDDSDNRRVHSLTVETVLLYSPIGLDLERLETKPPTTDADHPGRRQRPPESPGFGPALGAASPPLGPAL